MPARWRAIHAVRPGVAKWYSRAEPLRFVGGVSEQRRPMAEKNRDEFTEKTKLQIAKGAGWLCSDPSCRRPTIGSNSDGTGEINLGIAAHICAAAPGGPRYDPDMTREQRQCTDNDIWLCQNHAKAVDVKDPMFTVELLHEWKAQAKRHSWWRVLHNDLPHGPVAQAPSEDELSARLRTATAADLEVFRRSDKWPPTAIALTLEVDGQSDPVSTTALANALTTLVNGRAKSVQRAE